MAGSVERALHILVELAPGPVTISELARRLNVHRTTSLRLLRVLEDEQFVRRDPEGRYRLGPRMITLAYAALEGYDSRSAAHSHIRALGARCGQTVHLAALEGDRLVYLDKVESQQAVRMYSRIGATAPLHATGVGKAILAHLAPEIRAELLGDPPYRRCTPNTHIDLESLEQDLQTVARRGWALDDFEHEEFIHCVAAPVFDTTGNVVAAISISTPGMILDHHDLVQLVPDLISTAADISEELGWNTL